MVLVLPLSFYAANWLIWQYYYHLCIIINLNLLKEPNPFQNIRYYCYNKDLFNCIEHIILVDVC